MCLMLAFLYLFLVIFVRFFNYGFIMDEIKDSTRVKHLIRTTFSPNSLERVDDASKVPKSRRFDLERDQRVLAIFRVQLS